MDSEAIPTTEQHIPSENDNHPTKIHPIIPENILHYLIHGEHSPDSRQFISLIVSEGYQTSPTTPILYESLELVVPEYNRTHGYFRMVYKPDFESAPNQYFSPMVILSFMTDGERSNFLSIMIESDNPDDIIYTIEISVLDSRQLFEMQVDKKLGVVTNLSILDFEKFTHQLNLYINHLLDILTPCSFIRYQIPTQRL